MPRSSRGARSVTYPNASQLLILGLIKLGMLRLDFSVCGVQLLLVMPLGLFPFFGVLLKGGVLA